MTLQAKRSLCALIVLALTLVGVGLHGALPAFAAGGNLALNKPVTASEDDEKMPAGSLTDGDPSTRWSAEAGPTQWAYVDLGESTQVARIKLTWESDKEHAADFKLYVSDDTEAWGEPVKTVTGNDGKISDITLDAPATGRYVKLEVTKISNYPNVSCGEMEVYGEAGGDPAVEPRNLALKKTTKASVDYNREDGARAVDGKRKDGKTDRWMTEAQPVQWVYVDLGQSEAIKHFEIYWEGAQNYATDFKVYVSDSTDEWGEPVVKEQGNKLAQNGITLQSPVKGRYVKLEVEKMSSPWGVSCMEFEVWNEVPPAPDKEPADYLNDITIDPVTAETEKLGYKLPEAPEGYEIKYNGTDYEQVIDLDGTIFHPVSDVTVKASFKITNKTDNTDYAFKEFEVKVPGSMTAAEGANAAPSILPELREWVGGTGSFKASDAKRVLYADASLKVMAEEFARDFAKVTGVELKVVEGTSAQGGDILFTLTKDTSLGLKDEGYLLEAKADKIVVTAEQVAGANWGGKTILQGMTTGSGSFPVGTSRDYPLYKVRGFILDVGRKTFTLDWLKMMTEQMAWFKMNDFQIHLNDNLIPLEYYTNKGEDAMQAYSGFRLESDVKKGGDNGRNQADLTSTDVWYTKADFKDYIEHSKALGVNIIPEIDTPAHSLALTKVRPDLRFGTNGRQNDHLDLRGDKFDQSLSFVKGIFDEYMLGGEDAVFAGADVVHIGADEYNVGNPAESGPLYRKFVNEMFDYARANGHTPRVWGSLSQYTQGDPIKVDGGEGQPRAQINLWNWGYANMDKMYEMGFDLIDCNDGHFYIVPNAGYYYDYLNKNTVYTDPLNSIGECVIPAGDPQVIGGAFAVWNDMTDYLENGITEYDVYHRVNDAMGLFAANSWGRGTLGTDEASALAKKLGDDPTTNFHYEAAADAEGFYAQWNMDDLSDATDMGRDLVATGTSAQIATVDGRKALKLDGGDSHLSVADKALTTVGLGNDIRVKVKRTSASTDPQVLFESDYGQIMAVQEGTGKVGFTRENHAFSFDYELPVNEWVELEFKNELTKTHLLVNGELVDTLGDGDKAAEGKPLKATTMFPVERIGSATNSFVGYVDDVRISTVGEFSSTMELDYAVLNAEAVLSEQDVPGLRELLDQAYEVFKEGKPEAARISELADQINAMLTGEDGKPNYDLADYCRLDAYSQLQGGDIHDALMGLFTPSSTSHLNAAWSLVRKNLPVSMQETVDSYENAIVGALDGMELNGSADLSFIDQSTLTATASDYQHDGSDPKNVLDGNLGTMWHSDWSMTTGEHWLTLTSNDPMDVNGISYTPRQSGANGNIKKYRVEVSTDGTTFNAVKEGNLDVKGTDPITIEFDRQNGVKAVKLVWVEAVNGNAAAAEINLLNAGAAPDYEGLQQLVDFAGSIKKDGPCDHDDFTAETWDALQQQIEAAKACIDEQSGDVNSVFTLKGELAKAVMGLRLSGGADPEPGYFTVTIDDRVPGHEDIVLKVKEGDTVPAQPDPELAGWKFTGWFTDGHEGGWKDKWDFNTPVTSDLTLTAQWVKDGDGSTVEPDDPSGPVNPSKPGTDGSLAQTGDNTMLYVGGIAVVAVVAIVAGIALSRRNKRG
ncbi:MAG: discoidin domain-containing protein [Collinsella sp.]|nr:discoidin domain-containing protein [Collinsella sp.]